MTPPTSANRFLEAAYRHGYLCVDLFFVLSGFVMSLVHQDVVQGPFSWRVFANFLTRRLARIYPLYLISTIAALAVFAWLHLRTFEGQLLQQPLLTGEIANLLMVQTWGLFGSFNGAAWSISAEWSAYLLFPLFARAVFRSKPLSRTLVLLGIIVCLAGLVYYPNFWLWRDSVPALRHGPLDRTTHHSVAPLLRCWTEFCLGMFAFQLFGKFQTKRSPMVSLLCAATSVCLMAAFAFPETDLFVVLLYVPLIATIALSGSAQAQILGNRLIYRAGVYSYSFYMLFVFAVDCRNPITQALSHILGQPSFIEEFLTTTSIVFAAAAISFHFFERPVRKHLRVLMRH